MSDTGENEIWTVVYAHGKNGNPWHGQKISHMRSIVFGMEMNLISVPFDEQDDVTSMIAQVSEICGNKNTIPDKCIFVGSSRGAYILSAASANFELSRGRKVDGLFMLAPAIFKNNDYYPGPFPIPRSKLTSVIHGYDDDIVDWKLVVNFCMQNKISCHLLDSGHRLTNEKVLIGKLLHHFLCEAKLTP